MRRAALPRRALANGRLRHAARVALVLSGLWSLPAHGWGPTGHVLIAEVATQRLSPAARARVAELLGGDSLAAVSNWADDVRELRPETARWHFVDIPRRRSAYDAHADCWRGIYGDCVVAAVDRLQRTLADPRQPARRRAEALKFLVHLIGDAHQPLHCATDHDRGGNDVAVTFFGEPTDLHWVWDTGIISRSGRSPDASVRALLAWASAHDAAGLERGTMADWVTESHAVAVEHAYRIPADHRLGAAYVDANRPVVDRQLATAGIRLARVLNDALR